MIDDDAGPNELGGGTFTEELENDKKVEDQISRYRSEISSLKRENSQKRAEIDKLRELLDMIQKIEAEHNKPPAWASPQRDTNTHVGTINLLLSDLHLDEVVNLDEMEGLNTYDREIAEMRLTRCVERTIFLARDYISGVKYDGMSLMLGGDLISGFIHDELAETNEAPIPETVEYWLDPLSAAIGAFADEFGHVRVSGVVGNHGRLTHKPRAKRRVTDNIDWLIYRLLMRDYKNDSRVTWQIPYSADTTVQIYNTQALLTHGDQFRGGSGIAGALSPLMLGAHRKAKRAMQIDKNFDFIVMGHWHTYAAFKNIVVNGSLKGYDEYAYTSNFDYEPPQQAFWLTTPEHGVTFSAPVLVQDRTQEGW